MITEKIGRNDPCACGSGKKYKHCCLQREDPKSGAGTVDIHALLQTGLTHHNSGQLTQAEDYYRQVLRHQPDQVDALNLLGLLAYQNGDDEQAGSLLDRALQRIPHHPSALFHRGLVHTRQDNPGAAEQCFRSALQTQPTLAIACYHLGLLLKDQQRLDEAEQNLRRALELNPRHADAHHAMGNVLQMANRLTDAEASYRQALALQPGHADACNGLGPVLVNQGRLDEAAQVFHHLLQIRPDDADGHFSLGMIHLVQGNFAEGWAHYEHRRQLGAATDLRPDLRYPEWRGEPLAGRRLLLMGEQGMGDQIQFIRYARMLRDQGACVDALVSPGLAELIKTAAGIERVFAALSTTEEYDYWTLMLSVPGRVGTDLSSIPCDTRYLQADPSLVAQWREHVEPLAAGRRKIGLVWAGNALHRNDRFRSMRLEMLAPLAGIPDIAWFSLQKGPAEADTHAGLPLHPLGPRLRDFSDTAAAIENMDLVISVDTSVVHLAGALGKPVWVLLPANPDWRWLLERRDSPWYPSARLFRQSRLGDWRGVVEQVCAALQPAHEK
jgi:Tfp pilus assembly protein PilF